MNYNVLLTFAIRIGDGVATGIWASSVLSTYINVLEGGDAQANEVRLSTNTKSCDHRLS